MAFSAAAHVTTASVVALGIASNAVFCAFALAQTSQEATLPQVVVTASRLPQSSRDILTDNTVITPEEIAQAGQTSLVELLQQRRGLQISRTGGPGNTSSVFIRGASNAQSIVLIDGVRIGSSAVGGATWETIPLNQVDHIEIAYGPLSSLYGADAMGGVVQIFTKKGEGKPTLSASAGGGRYGTSIFDAGISGSTSGDKTFRYALNVGREKSSGFSASKPTAGPFVFNPDKDGYKKESGSGQLSLEFAKGHELGLIFLKSRLNAQFDNGPGYDDRNIQELESYALYSRNQFRPNWKSLVQIARSVDSTFTDTLFEKSNIETRQTHISWQNDISLGTDIVQLIIETREEQAQASTQELNRTRRTNSAAAAYQLIRGNHLATLALRHDDSSQFGSRLTGNLAYGYRITEELRANASFGTSFRAPSFNELYFPGFGIASNQPEKGKNVELGLRYETGASQFSAVYFRNQITDLLVNTTPCPVEQETHAFGCAFNVDRALLEGVSLGGNRQMGNFTLRASLDFLNPRNRTTGALLPRRAKRHGSAALEYSVQQAKAGVELIVSGKRFDDAANTSQLGGYGVVNLFASYGLSTRWSLFGRWNNVLRKDYELAKGYATPGSNLFVGLRYSS